MKLYACTCNCLDIFLYILNITLTTEICISLTLCSSDDDLFTYRQTSTIDWDQLNLKTNAGPPWTKSHPGSLHFCVFEWRNQTTASRHDVVIVTLVLVQFFLSFLTSTSKNYVVLTVQKSKWQCVISIVLKVRYFTLCRKASYQMN